MLTGLTEEPKGPEESDTSKLLNGKGMVHQAYFGAISKMGKLETKHGYWVGRVMVGYVKSAVTVRCLVGTVCEK